MKTIKQLACAALVLGLTQVSRADLVTNGGFETGDFSGWKSLTGNDGFTGVTNNFGGASPYAGTYEGYFGAAGSDGILSQKPDDEPHRHLRYQFCALQFRRHPQRFHGFFRCG